MLPIQQLRIASPHDVEPGALLFNARYDRSPRIVCALGDDRFVMDLDIEFERPIQREGPRGFQPRKMAINFGPHIVIDEFDIEVDYNETISPNKSDIPLGALCLDGEDWLIKADMNYHSIYVGLDGQIRQEGTFDNFAAFAKWRVLARNGDKSVTLVEYDLGRTHKVG